MVMSGDTASRVGVAKLVCSLEIKNTQAWVFYHFDIQIFKLLTKKVALKWNFAPKEKAMSYYRHDMQYDTFEYYKWTEILTHTALQPIHHNNLPFDRFQGHHVLSLINALSKEIPGTAYNTNAYRKMEEMIRKYLPDQCKTFGAASQWISDHWYENGLSEGASRTQPFR